MSICNPFDAALIGQNFTIFALGQGLNVVILLCHAMVALFVARESVLIHMDEVEKKSISQMLDRKVYLNIEAQGFVTEVRETEDAQNGANPASDATASLPGEDEPNISNADQVAGGENTKA
jgi:hypothetical protein